MRGSLAHEQPTIRLCSLGAFIALRRCYSDFQDRMRGFLEGDDAQLKIEALAKAELYMRGPDIQLLRLFREDRTICVVDDGSRRFALRDLGYARRGEDRGPEL